MITVHTPRAPIKIFATGTGKFFFMQKRLFAALGFSEQSELGETVIDMCRYALARRRIGRHYLLDLQLLVRDILPVLLEMFDESPEINSAREVHTLLSKGLNEIMTQPVAPFKKSEPPEESEQLEYLPKIGLCVLNNVPINVYKNGAGEIFLQCNHLLQALGLSRTKSLTSGDFGRFLTEHNLPHKVRTDGIGDFANRSVIVLKGTDVRDLLLPNILSGAIKFNTADSKRRNARIILDDLNNYLEGKVMPPENVKPEVAETKSDTTEKEIPTAVSEEEKLDDTRALIDELAAVTDVPKKFIANALFNYKLGKMTDALERWRERLINGAQD
ncbi:MAG: hypothetical protein IKO05_11930 [Selenomonadaceae bacterium]|nr:hypothetical protein [Selenomonadaceae bacterium]